MYYHGVDARVSRVLTEVSSACLVAVSIVVACLRCARVVGFAGFVLYGCLQRQFHRLVEMLILKHMDPADERANRAYRLQVKERLYRFNFVRTPSSLALLFFSSSPFPSSNSSCAVLFLSTGMTDPRVFSSSLAHFCARFLANVERYGQ